MGTRAVSRIQPEVFFTREEIANMKLPASSEERVAFTDERIKARFLEKKGVIVRNYETWQDFSSARVIIRATDWEESPEHIGSDNRPYRIEGG